MPADENPRYNDPFVRLLELWVLATLGAISPEDRQTMKEIEPELREIYAVADLGWKKIIEQIMEFGPGAADELRGLWLERKEEMVESGGTISPQRFAEETVDRLFGPDAEPEE